MTEVGGALVAIALVLCSVFIPTAFISGITGAFFRQFALTIAVSTIISAFNSLTLSPALCALLLRPAGMQKGRRGEGEKRESTRRQPLPRLSFVLLGSWLSWHFLTTG